MNNVKHNSSQRETDKSSGVSYIWIIVMTSHILEHSFILDMKPEKGVRKDFRLEF